jgi:predicted acyltransferase
MAAIAPKSGRLVSLDLLRGLTVIGMIVVNSAAYLESLGGYPAYPALLHSVWAGYTIADAVFPAFIVMVGVSIAVSLAPAKARGGSDPARVGLIGLRALRLIASGLVISNVAWLFDFDHNPWRAFGVLQRIGLTYFATAVVYLNMGPRSRLTLAAALLLTYWPLTLVPCPDGVPTDLNAVGANFVSWTERAMLDVHAYRSGPRGYDPEGLLGVLPSIAQALIGVAAGEWLLAKGRTFGAPVGLGLAGILLTVAGLAWGLVFPPVKAIWSSSYVLLSSGPALLALAGLYAAFDLKGWRISGMGLVLAFGVNAIFAYMLHELASIVLEAEAARWLCDHAVSVMPPEAASLVPVVAFLILVWLPVGYLYRRGWLIKI